MTDQPRGNFRINLNRSKKLGDNQPIFDRGIISTPDAPDERFDVKLWGYKDKNGRPFFAGPSSVVTSDATAIERAHALMEAQVKEVDTATVSDGGSLQLGDNQVMLFPNGHKIAKDDARYSAMSGEEREVNDRRPDLWGQWNPGSGKKQVRIAAWDLQGRYGPFLGGNTQYPMPGKNVAKEATGPDEGPDMEATRKSSARGKSKRVEERADR